MQEFLLKLKTLFAALDHAADNAIVKSPDMGSKKLIELCEGVKPFAILNVMVGQSQGIAGDCTHARFNTSFILRGLYAAIVNLEVKNSCQSIHVGGGFAAIKAGLRDCGFEIVHPQNIRNASQVLKAINEAVHDIPAFLAGNGLDIDITAGRQYAYQECCFLRVFFVPVRQLHARKINLQLLPEFVIFLQVRPV